jgi:hypothetical protein
MEIEESTMIATQRPWWPAEELPVIEAPKGRRHWSIFKVLKSPLRWNARRNAKIA